ncbi:MAG: hypothetical protein HY929_06295 [Euryarchaeota archaeon]|nr:hypothetical protein [Euryarchaeota archaeon]
MKVVCNAGPLIALGRLNALHLLSKNYERILISREVYTEAVTRGIEKGHVDALRIKRLVEQSILTIKDAPRRKQKFKFEIDIGEIETICLALQEKADLVLMDDWYARMEAKRAGLKVKGTLGVLYDSFKNGIIDFKHFESMVEEIIYREDIWINKDLCRKVIQRAKKLIKN